MAHNFTSLSTSIEKLLEAEYFLGGLATSGGSEFHYNLNAFLSACRSVTLVLQKSMAQVADFGTWYAARRVEMRDDRAMGFFLELRNISQHEGAVSVVGGSTLDQGWTYRFAGNREAVPAELVGRDATCACADHLIKVARLLAAFLDSFPHESCIYAAITREGIERLGLTLDDAAALLGLPSGFLDVGPGFSLEEKLRFIQREFDPIDADAVRRLAAGQILRGGGPLLIENAGGRDLTDDIAALIENGEVVGCDPRTVFLTAIGRRIHDLES